MQTALGEIMLFHGHGRSQHQLQHAETMWGWLATGPKGGHLANTCLHSFTVQASLE